MWICVRWQSPKSGQPLCHLRRPRRSTTMGQWNTCVWTWVHLTTNAKFSYSPTLCLNKVRLCLQSLCPQRSLAQMKALFTTELQTVPTETSPVPFAFIRAMRRRISFLNLQKLPPTNVWMIPLGACQDLAAQVRGHNGAKCIHRL